MITAHRAFTTILVLAVWAIAGDTKYINYIQGSLEEKDIDAHVAFLRDYVNGFYGEQDSDSRALDTDADDDEAYGEDDEYDDDEIDEFDDDEFDDDEFASEDVVLEAAVEESDPDDDSDPALEETLEEMMARLSQTEEKQKDQYLGHMDYETDLEFGNELEELEDEFDDRPFIVFHLGPARTATTSLQTDLTKMKEDLERDNYHYAGRYYNPLYRPHYGKWVMNRSSSKLGDEAAKMFKTCNVTEVKAQEEEEEEDEETTNCMSTFLEELAPFQKDNMNVIISDESLAQTWGREQFLLVDEVLRQDWKVIVTVGYRRFFDWSDSINKELNRFDRPMLWKSEWPHLLDSEGHAPELLFPDEVFKWREYDEYNRFTTSFLNLAEGTDIDIKVLNMHSTEVNIRTDFVCNHLKNAKNSCSASRRMDRNNRPASHIDNRNEDAILHVNFDLVTIAAAEADMIDVRQFDRVDVREALEQYAKSLKKTAFDFELTCPDEHAYRHLLQESVELEKEVFGESFTYQMEQDHRAAFQERVDSNVFCWPNTEAVLEDEVWKTFFEAYAPLKTKAVQSRRASSLRAARS